MTPRPDRARHMSHTCLPTLVPPEQGKHRLQDHEPERNADQGVAGQRVSHRRHCPDRQAAPARRRRDHVHEHADGDRCHVQHPRPDRPPAMQRQRDPQRREHHRTGIRDRRLQSGDHRQPPRREHQPVLRRETHHRGRNRQHPQPRTRITQPRPRTIQMRTQMNHPPASPARGHAGGELRRQVQGRLAVAGPRRGCPSSRARLLARPHC